MGVFIKCPADCIHSVNAIIPKLGCTCIPEPVPGINISVQVERAIWRWIKKKIPVNTLWNRTILNMS